MHDIGKKPTMSSCRMLEKLRNCKRKRRTRASVSEQAGVAKAGGPDRALGLVARRGTYRCVHGRVLDGKTTAHAREHLKKRQQHLDFRTSFCGL